MFGPVVSEVFDIAGEEPVALLWISTLVANESGTSAPFVYDTTVDSFLSINHAHNFDEFRDALRSYVAPSQNFIYADVEGNIGKKKI